MKITVNECYQLLGDYQNQFLGVEVFPKPKYKRLNPSERTVNKVHYNDVYILEPLHYYYVNFNEKIDEIDGMSVLKTNNSFAENGLLMYLSSEESRMYLFNTSQNIVYLQKGVKLGEVVQYG